MVVVENQTLRPTLSGPLVPNPPWPIAWALPSAFTTVDEISGEQHTSVNGKVTTNIARSADTRELRAFQLARKVNGPK